MENKASKRQKRFFESSVSCVYSEGEIVEITPLDGIANLSLRRLNQKEIKLFLEKMFFGGSGSMCVVEERGEKSFTARIIVSGDAVRTAVDFVRREYELCETLVKNQAPCMAVFC